MLHEKMFFQDSHLSFKLFRPRPEFSFFSLLGMVSEVGCGVVESSGGGDVIGGSSICSTSIAGLDEWLWVGQVVYPSINL